MVQIQTPHQSLKGRDSSMDVEARPQANVMSETMY
jgi:hypothetical protein